MRRRHLHAARGAKAAGSECLRFVYLPSRLVKYVKYKCLTVVSPEDRCLKSPATALSHATANAFLRTAQTLNVVLTVPRRTLCLRLAVHHRRRFARDLPRSSAVDRRFDCGLCVCVAEKPPLSASTERHSSYTGTFAARARPRPEADREARLPQTKMQVDDDPMRTQSCFGGSSTRGTAPVRCCTLVFNTILWRSLPVDCVRSAGWGVPGAWWHLP